MESNNLVCKVQSGKDLKGFNFFQKLLVYARASLFTDDPEKKLDQNQQQRTPTDKEGDGDPEWNHDICFDMKEISFEDCDHLFLRFELFHEGIMFGDKPIGEVRVPLKELMETSNGITRFVSYQVQTTDRKANGVLNFSYIANVNGGNCLPGTQITGLSVADEKNRQSVDNLYPTSEIHSLDRDIESPAPEIHSFVHQFEPSAPEIRSSVPQFEHLSQELHSTVSDERQYPLPNWTPYYPPAAPPPPLHHGRFPPPPRVHVGFHHHPHHHHHHHHHHRPEMRGWRPENYGFAGGYDYSMNVNHGRAVGPPYGYGGEVGGYRSPGWNGR